MNPEDQQIAIAKAVGWQIKQVKVSGMLDVLLVPPGWPKDAMAYTGDLPDYLNDLNAMHEAEKVLTNNQRREYARQLVKVTPLQYETANSNDNNDHRMAVFFVVNATAAQRAEAFLKAKGLWV